MCARAFNYVTLPLPCYCDHGGKTNGGDGSVKPERAAAVAFSQESHQ